MNQDEFRQKQINARAQFSRHDCNMSSDPNMRSNCGACCLAGYHPRGERSDFINYAGWARVYIQAGKHIPDQVRFDFMADLASDNQSYANALKQDIRDFGIVCEPGAFRTAVRSVLGVYDD